MFKKFKDKLAEEMKQSPARLQASMQQLAQAVVSPALSNSSIQELSASNDNFSLTEEGDETPKNSPARHGFQNVDLTSPSSNSMVLSRRSSVSSVASVDAASLFPIYESPGNMYHLQSDMEQSASEADEKISPQLDRVTKDQLYSAYRKVQTKYHKYRGRYTDLANHYREMERVKGKLEALLVETQDKALRRIADLKEQCQLEQQAKAHLEEALRNDIEEKDHVIDTLNTKVRLLQASGPLASSSSTLDEPIENNRSELLIDVSTEVKPPLPDSEQSEVAILASENSQLKSKLEKLESLITKYKESLKRNKEKMSEITQEKSIIERDFEISRKSSSEKFSQLEDDLNLARTEILSLRDQMTAMRKREEESVISLAENKLTIHRELEVKEEQIKELRKELALAKQNRESLEESVERYKSELQSLKTSNDESTDAEKADLVRDLSKGKTEALKLMQAEMQRRVIELEETMGRRCHEEESKCRELTEKLERREEDLRCFERETIELRSEAEDYREKCEALRNELSIIKDKEYLEAIDAKRNDGEQDRQAVMGQKETEVEFRKNNTEAQIAEVQEKLKEIEAKFEDAKKILEVEEKKYSEVQHKLNEAEARYAETEKNCNDVTERLREAKKSYSDVDQKRIEAEAKYNEVEKLRRELEQQREASEAEIKENNIAKEKSQEKGSKDSKEAEYAEKETENSYKIECEKLREELSILRGREESSTDGSKVEESSGAAEKDETIKQLNSKVQLYATAIQKAKERLESQQNELIALRNSVEQDNELSKLREENESKTVEILGIASELKSSKTMINDLREKIRSDTEKIDLLTKEKICLISNVLQYGKIIAELGRECGNLKKSVEDSARTRKSEFERVAKIFEDKLSSIASFENARRTETIEKLERELNEKNDEIAAMRDKVERWDVTNKRNDKLIAEIDSLNFKIYDLEKARQELVEIREKFAALEIENRDLRNGSDESEKLRNESEKREKDLNALQTENEELRKDFNDLTQANERMKIDNENERKIHEEKDAEMEKELERLKNEGENRKRIVDDYASKLNFFEAECAERDRGLETLRVEMEKREKLLEDTIEKSKNTEAQLTKLIAEKLGLETEIENREKIILETTEKAKNFEIELSKLSEEKAKLIIELETLKTSSAEFEGSNDALKESINSKNALLKKLKVLKERQAQTIQESATKIAELETKITELATTSRDLEEEKTKNEMLATKISELEATTRDLKEEKTKNETLLAKISELEAASSDFENEKSQNALLQRRINELEATNRDLEAEKLKNEQLEAKIIELEKSLREDTERLEIVLSKTTKERDDLEKIVENSRQENSLRADEILKLESQSKKTTEERVELEKILENLRDELEFQKKESKEKSNELERTSDEAKTLKEQLEEKSIEQSKQITLLTDEAKKLKEQLEEKSAEQTNQIASLTDEAKKLKEQLEEKSAEQTKQISLLTDEAKKLKEQMEEKSSEQEKQISTLKDEIAKREEELKALSENSGKRLEDFEELRDKLEQDFHNRADRMEDEYMAKYREKETEARNIEIELKSKLAEKESELLKKNEETSQDENSKRLIHELTTRLQDSETRLSSCEAKESQIGMLNEELKSQTEALKKELETNEAEQSMRLKQLVKEFQAQLHDKDEELQAALDKRFESQQNYESDLVQQYREQLKDFQVELTAKSEQIERLILEKKEEMATKTSEVEKLIDTIGKIKQEHANELREVERKWKLTVKQKSEQLETKHEEEVNELTQEWQNERRNDEKTGDSPEELESTSRVAMAAVQSNTGSLHSLQQTMVSQRRELAELRKLVKLRQDTLEDSTEIEYLRNILYEYMMGRETVVLARVIAAVVKFDQDQTTKILKKEEDKLTLLGSLGLT